MKMDLFMVRNVVHGHIFLVLLAYYLLFVSCLRGETTCEQIDRCRCNLTDGSGVIDLSRVAQYDNTPKWFDIKGKDGYYYSYNPCVSFTEGPYCGDVAACKTASDRKTRWTIADPATPHFRYDGSHAHLVYSYNISGNYSLLDVEFVCNFSSYSDDFMPLGESAPGSGIYNATVSSRCACPNVCVFPPNCAFVSPCSCNMTDWSGMVDISQFAKKDGLPAFADVNGTDGYLYSYNPCRGFTEGACKNVTGCRTSPDLKVQEPLGDPSSAQFFYRDDSDVHIVYSMNSDTQQERVFDVTLYCDYDADPPVFVAFNETKNGSNIFTATLHTPCACPGECSGNPVPKCMMVNECSCNMTDGSGVIDLSFISNTDGTPRFSDELSPDGLYYSYNPCHGFTEGSCQNVTGCQVDDNKSMQYPIADLSSTRFYNDGTYAHVSYNHTEAESGVQRFLDITLVCDRSMEEPVFIPNGKPTEDSNLVTGRLVSKCACPNGCSSRPRPSCLMINQCACNTTDGSGIVDISSLAKKDGLPAFPDFRGSDGYYYSYNPCYGFSEGTCSNVTVCKVTSTEAAQYTLAYPGSAHFLYDGFFVHIVHISKTNFGFVNTFDVTLICDESVSTPEFSVDGEIGLGKGNYTASLKSKCACPGGCV